MGDLRARGYEVARQLGHHWAGPEHMVLAILRGGEDDLGRQALTSLGVTTEAFEAALVGAWARAWPTPVVPTSTPAEHVTGNPASYALDGWATACAQTLGDGTVRGPEVLLGVVYRDQDVSVGLLDHLGAPPDRILARLGELGVPLPAVPPPSHRPRRRPQIVPIPRDQLHDAIAVLRERFPPTADPRWGFNYDDQGAAYLTADPDVDLEAIVEALPRPSQVRGPDGV